MHVVMLSYDWLVNQNLWKAVVTWTVGIVLTATFVQRPWRKHKAAQAKIIDQLDVSTPGGLQEVSSLLSKLSDDISAIRKDAPGEGNPGR